MGPDAARLVDLRQSGRAHGRRRPSAFVSRSPRGAAMRFIAAGDLSIFVVTPSASREPVAPTRPYTIHTHTHVRGVYGK